MKVAILYSGLPNLTNLIVNNHKQYIYDHYHCDTYLSTYDIDNEPQQAQQTLDLLKPRRYDIEKWTNVSKEFKEIANTITYKRPETQNINVLSMFYKIKKCYDLLNETYDIVIRCRLDIMFSNRLILENNDFINIPSGGDYHGGIGDVFAYGSQNNMQKYCSLYDHIKSFIANQEIVFHPESILKYYLLKNNTPINRFKYNIYLRNTIYNI
jgi:hypothetical protein